MVIRQARVVACAPPISTIPDLAGTIIGSGGKVCKVLSSVVTFQSCSRALSSVWWWCRGRRPRIWWLPSLQYTTACRHSTLSTGSLNLSRRVRALLSGTMLHLRGNEIGGL